MKMHYPWMTHLLQNKNCSFLRIKIKLLKTKLLIIMKKVPQNEQKMLIVITKLTKPPEVLKNKDNQTEQTLKQK